MVMRVGCGEFGADMGRVQVKLAMLLLTVWIATITFYLLFLVWASYHQARIAGRYIPLSALILIGPPVLFGYVLDVVWNTLLGSLLFVEVPWAENWRPWTWTFTGRLIRWKNNLGWRGRQARQWALLINWADPHHV